MTSPTALRRTPLYDAHVRLGARMVPFAGYEMPVQYTGVLDETKAVRRDAGLFDVSHMGQFSVRGARALDAVQALVSNDLRKIALGQAQYNMLCNERGGVIDDLIVYRRAEDDIFICVNASNREADFAWMKGRLPAGVAFEDQSDDTALIAVQGPKSEAILAEGGAGDAARALKYYWAADTKVFGHRCFLSRTGYTGEDGFELYLAAADAASIWERLLETGRRHGLTPTGLGARDTLRLEMGYPLHGHEISTDISPLAANLGWVVKLQRPEAFPGQAALKAEAERGPAQVLRALVVADRRIPRTGYRLVDAAKRPVGVVTSGSFSPHRNAPIALGLVDREAAAEPKLFVEVREALVPADVVKLPFVPSRTKKNG